MIVAIKSIARRLISERIVGHLDYYRFPERGHIWGGPFNGQQSRAALFRSLMDHLSPAAIVETGAYLGTTTEFFADFSRPVFTVENDPRAYGFARARLWKRRNVILLPGDSRQALRKLLDGPRLSLRASTVFFYLDAHWSADLPLAEELEIIFSRCPAAIVMIDDFKVPFDAGYGYDDFGPNKALTADYVARTMQQHGLYSFYPSTSAIEETGARRGCVVFVKEGKQSVQLRSIPLLSPYSLCDRLL